MTPTDMQQLEQRLDAIEARAEKATPGPWAWYGADVVSNAPRFVSQRVAQLESRNEMVPNAEFIAHARTDIPDLCQAARRLIALERGLRELVADYRETATKYDSNYWHERADELEALLGEPAPAPKPDELAELRRKLRRKLRELMDRCFEAGGPSPAGYAYDDVGCELRALLGESEGGHPGNSRALT